MYRFCLSQCPPCDRKLLGEYRTAVTDGDQIPGSTPDDAVLQECAGAYSLSRVLFWYIVKSRSSSKHGGSVVRRVAAASSDGAKTSALSRSELIIAST